MGARNSDIGDGRRPRRPYGYSNSNGIERASSTGSAVIAHSGDLEIREQLEDLRTQVRRLEAGQGSSSAYSVIDSELPPAYTSERGEED
jgi:hypothetical protein